MLPGMISGRMRAVKENSSTSVVPMILGALAALGLAVAAVLLNG